MSLVCCLHILNSSKNIVTVGAGKLFLGCFLCPFPYFQQMRHFCKIHPFLIMLDRKGAYLRLHFCHIFILSSLLLSDHCPPITQGCCCEPNWVFFRYNSISRTLLFNLTLGRRGYHHKCRWISSKIELQGWDGVGGQNLEPGDVKSSQCFCPESFCQKF